MCIRDRGMALDVGRIFYPGHNILAYNELGIGRLIHQLPLSLCDMFLKEVFGERDVSEFEEETLCLLYTSWVEFSQQQVLVKSLLVSWKMWSRREMSTLVLSSLRLVWYSLP